MTSDLSGPHLSTGAFGHTVGPSSQGCVEETYQSGACKCILFSKILGCLAPFGETVIDHGTITQIAQLTSDRSALNGQPGLKSLPSSGTAHLCVALSLRASHALPGGDNWKKFSRFTHAVQLECGLCPEERLNG